MSEFLEFLGPLVVLLIAIFSMHLKPFKVHIGCA